MPAVVASLASFGIAFVSAANMPAVRAALPSQCLAGTTIVATFDRVLPGSNVSPYFVLSGHPDPRFNGMYHIRSVLVTSNAKVPNARPDIRISGECVS